MPGAKRNTQEEKRWTVPLFGVAEETERKEMCAFEDSEGTENIQTGFLSHCSLTINYKSQNVILNKLLLKKN